MKTKLLLSLAVAGILLLIPVKVGAIDGEDPDLIPFPDCGEITLGLGELIPPKFYENVQLVVDDHDQPLYLITSNGWKITEVIYYGEIEGYYASLYYPQGMTKFVFSKMPTPPGMGIVWNIFLHFEQDCSAPPKFTGRYVYTLLGNYPCNLISEETTIPARFLNPDYTAPLCSLPDLPHSWNGEWVKSKEYEINGEFIGGNHYDTRLD